jgi:tetratricopeptide (TPR) repeat protein
MALACLHCGICANAQEYNDTVKFASDSVSRLQDAKRRLMMNAKRQSFEGNIDQAAILYHQAIAIDPECDACYYELANLLIYMDKEPEAKENAAKACSLDPANSWFALLYGRLCFHFREYDKAQRLFRQILVQHGKKQDVWFGLASAYEEQKLFPEALGVLDSMVMRFGENDDISYRIFSIAMDIGNYDRAIPEIKKLADSYSGDPRFSTLLADAYAETDNDTLAVKAYDKAIEANDAFSPALLGKAELFRKKGMFANYFKTLQKYAANRDIKPEAKAEYLGLILKIPAFASHFKHNIDTVFAILTAIHPVSIELQLMRAHYFAATHRLEQSISIFGQLTDMDSNNKEIWLTLLSIEYSLKMFSQLEQSSQKAIASDPGHATFYMYSALALWSQKKTKPAIETLEKGIAKARYDSIFMNNALSLLGDLYFSINKSKKAFACYEKALDNNPGNATVLNNYAYYLCLTKSKRMDKAYEMSKKAIEMESNNPSFLDTYAYILFLQGKYDEAKKMFRKALAFGGDESAVVLDHYADTLNKLGERTVAEIYWSQALDKPDCLNPEQIKKKLKGN